MKKLMTAFAACMIAGMVSAAVESVNIVGYTTVNVPLGFSMQTAPFIPVGGDGSLFTLGMIVPNENWDGNNNDMIQFIDAQGNTVRTAWYFAGYGWYDFDDSSELNDLEIPAGIAGFVEATQEGAAFLVSGEVADELTVPLAQGFSLVGNPVAREITLGEVVPNEFWDGNNNDTIQFIDEGGNTIRTAWYFAGYGWYDFDDSSELNELPVAAGQGFFLEATQEGGALVFPAAI